MYTLIIKCTLMYIIVLVIVRMMGKRQLSQLQPFELVVTLMIADLAVIPLTSTNLPILHGAVPLLTLASLHYLTSVLSRKSIYARKLLCGNPVVVIDENGINYDKLRQLNMNISDLEESIHEQNFFNFSQIKFAIVETNGKITVIPKDEHQPITISDLKLKPKPSGLAITIIKDGKLLQDNINQMELTEKFIAKQIKRSKIGNLKDVFVMTLDNEGGVYIQSKTKIAMSFKSSYKSKVSE